MFSELQRFIPSYPFKLILVYCLHKKFTDSIDICLYTEAMAGQIKIKYSGAYYVPNPE